VTRSVRIGVFAAAGAVLALLLVWASVDLPRFGDYRGPYGYVLDRAAVPDRHVSEVVAATVFDYRGLDTLGEEFILFTAVTGIVLLLRERERERAGDFDDEVRSSVVRRLGALAVGPCVVTGIWLIAFGYVTPGGGFQGGVAVASAVVLLWLVSSYGAWSAVGDERLLDPLEGLGAGGYVVIGLAALVSGLPFLTNLFGPGTTGTLVSGGSIPLVNWAAGIEVAAAVLILFAEFLEEYIVPLSIR
jgi:multicomponent Na+:H+ antiporter subunit B